MRLRSLRRPPVLLLMVLAAIAVLVAVLWPGPSTGARDLSRDGAGAIADRVSAAPRSVRRVDADSFARQVAHALLGYDTASSRTQWRRSVLSLAGVPEGSLGAEDIDRLIPDDGQWGQMAVVHQRVTLTLGATYVPTLWTETAAQHPELPAGSAGITVTGTQLVTWDGGSSRVPVAVTLLIVCPPETQPCALSRVLAQVAR
jgi:hypothetical protein